MNQERNQPGRESIGTRRAAKGDERKGRKELCVRLVLVFLTVEIHSSWCDSGNSPCRCRLSYSFSPKVWGSCRSSRAGKLGVEPMPATFFARFCNDRQRQSTTIFFVES
jgi:hypothetical protein